mmetsp:Transcript_63340/g.133582  ORF Transcript_63340/g.133582 Transcript_63340/m.133582 type:complete len:298 (+) Transcript_63340:831-1724(+)
MLGSRCHHLELEDAQEGAFQVEDFLLCARILRDVDQEVGRGRIPLFELRCNVQCYDAHELKTLPDDLSLGEVSVEQLHCQEKSALGHLPSPLDFDQPVDEDGSHLGVDVGLAVDAGGCHHVLSLLIKEGAQHVLDILIGLLCVVAVLPGLSQVRVNSQISARRFVRGEQAILVANAEAGCVDGVAVSNAVMVAGVVAVAVAIAVVRGVDVAISRSTDGVDAGAIVVALAPVAIDADSLRSKQAGLRSDAATWKAFALVLDVGCVADVAQRSTYAKGLLLSVCLSNDWCSQAVAGQHN